MRILTSRIPTFNFSEDLTLHFESKGKVIDPRFPNWQRSFVSGPNSSLFILEHRIDLENPSHLYTQVSFKPSAEGPPGHIHGGASAGLIDETMGIIAWHHHYTCVTQHLNLTYLRALPLGQKAWVCTQIEKVNSKKIEIVAGIYDSKKTNYVIAQGVFHRLTLEQFDQFMAQAK